MSSPAIPALLSVNEVTLSYGNQQLLRGVTFAVSAGEKVGLVGRNGCGKSSLLKILSGVEKADSGDLSYKRDIRIGYLPQEFELDHEKTVRENIELGVADLKAWILQYENGDGSEVELAHLQHQIEAADGWQLENRIKSITTALSAPELNLPVANLSGGEKRRVALCKALISEPDLLLLDEPTNHLDSESIRWLESYLTSFRGAVIFVTHDRYFLDVIATKIIEIDLGKAYTHLGNYTNYLENKSARQQIAEQSERRRQRFLRTELEWVRAGVKARGTKSRHRLESFYNVQGQEAPPEERELDLLLPPPAEIGNIAVELEQVNAIVGQDSEERTLFRNLTLSIRPGQCTGIVGRNGAGKTTLLKIMMGEREPDSGKATIGKKVLFNYIDQARMQLDGSNSVLNEISDFDEMVMFGSQKMGTRAYLKRFLFTDDRVNERIDRLSGGERARLMLAKVLKKGGNVIVLDEPTNDLDLPSLRMLEEALADFDGAVIVVSHDRYFLDRICDQIVAFEDGGVFSQPGNYSYYLEKKKVRDQVDREFLGDAAKVTKTPEAPKATRARKLTYKEQRELEGMEETILNTEARIQELEALLNDPEFFVTNYEQSPVLTKELEEKRLEIVRLYERWEELSAIAPA